MLFCERQISLQHIAVTYPLAACLFGFELVLQYDEAKEYVVELCTDMLMNMHLR